MAAESGPPKEIKDKCKKVQVVKGYALDPVEPHILITYREDWRDPTQKGIHYSFCYILNSDECSLMV
jgi:hypothetical protein